MKKRTFILVLLLLIAIVYSCGSSKTVETHDNVADAEKALAKEKKQFEKDQAKQKKAAEKRYWKKQTKKAHKSVKKNARRQKKRTRKLNRH